ncbi:MAG: hypothetical protein P4K94_07235 [Terracidiphilus sp.]|nr:hypothetical protein [Terracidiphilus sp.]
MKKSYAFSVSLAAGLLAFATVSISIAQTSAPEQSPPPLSGLTMEQTVASLNQTFTTQGNFTFTIHTDDAKVSNQKVVLEGPCTLLGTYDLVIPTVDSRPSRLLLDRADPLSLTLYTIRDSSPAVYIVLVSQPATHEDESRYIFAKPGMGIFYRKDLAERFEKALIHAIVLCHKPEAPSPF